MRQKPDARKTNKRRPSQDGKRLAQAGPESHQMREKDWERTFDAVPDLIAIIDPQHRILRVNRAMAERLGMTAEQCAGLTCYRCVHGLDEPPAFCPHAQALADGQEHTAEVYEERLGGHFLITCTPLFDEQGQMIGSVHVARDITERKQAEEALQEVNARLQVQAEELTTANEELRDGEQALQEANEQLQAQTEELRATNEELRLSERALQEANEQFQAQAEELQTQTEELRVANDELRLREQALRESEERYRSLFENMLDGYAYCQMLFDGQGRPVDFVYLSVNDAFTKLTSLQKVVGKKVTEVIPGIHQSHPELLETYGRVAMTGRPERFEIDFKPLGMWLSISVYSSQKGYFTVVFDNVTERKRAEEALRESEERYHRLFEDDLTGDFISTPEGQILLCNLAFARIFGFSRAQDAVGTNMLDLYIDPQERQLLVERLKQECKIERLEAWRKRRDGESIYIVENLVGHFNERGELYEVKGYIFDDTERKRAEEALRESRERLRLAQQAARIGTFEWDIPTGVNRWTPELEAMYGLPPGGFAGTQEAWEQLVHPGDREEILDRVAQASETGAPAEGEWRVVWPDGSIHWLAGRWQVFKDESGAPLRMTGINIDITERKRDEEELRESEARLRLALDAGRMGTWVWDLATDTVDTDPLHRRLWDLDNADGRVPSSVILQRIHPEDRALAFDRESVEHRLTGPSDMEFRVVRRDGTVTWLSGAAVPVRDAGGVLRKVIGVNFDMTERKRAEEALQESRTRLERAQEIAHLGSWELDLVNDRLTWSDEVYRIFGLQPQEFGATYEAFLDRVHPDDRAAVDAAYSGSLREGRDTYEVEHRIIRKSTGEVRIVHEKCEHVRDASGRIIRSVGMVHDITERKQAEEALRESEEKFRTLHALSPIGIVLNRLDNGQFLESNQALWDMTGYTEEEFRSLTYWDITPIEYQEMEVKQLELLHTVGRYGPYEKEYVRKDGSRFPVLLSGVRLEDPNGTDLIYSVIQDITKLKAKEQALRESEAALQRSHKELERSVQERTADLDAMTRLRELGALFVREGNLGSVLDEIIDAAIAISGADSGTIQLLGPTSSTLKTVRQRGLPEWWLDLWDNIPGGRGTCGTALARGERVIVEDVEQSPIFVGTPDLEIHRKAGVRAVQSTPLVSRSGKPLGMFSTHYRTPHRPDDRTLRLLDLLARQAADIIERAQTEETLREFTRTLETRVAERTAELQYRARQLQKLALELSETEERERKRLAEVLHDDLQQQLAAAKFHLQMLSNRLRYDPAQREITVKVDQMLKEAVEKSRSLSHELSPAVLYHGNLAETFTWLASQIHAKHGLIVHVDAFNEVMVQSDALKAFLYKAAQELLFNVVKHARVGEARIRLRRVGRCVCLSVSDHGRGFDPQDLRETAGFGLLSIRERIELLGGRMKIKSAKGQGSTFHIVVPDEQETEGTGQKTEDRLELPSVLRPPSSEPRLRVLLADDHQIVREGLVSLLAEVPGIEVVGEAANGREAINLTSRLRPDVVVMDVTMPLINGDEATRQIKMHLPGTRVIALSMYDDVDLIEKMRQAGAEGYVLKTAPSEELLAAIRGR